MDTADKKLFQPVKEKELTLKELDQDIELYEKMKIVAGLRNQIAELNLETTMMNSFDGFLQQAPNSYYYEELQQKYLPYEQQNKPQQESIDITGQQSNENIEANKTQEEEQEQQTDKNE